MLAHVWTLVGSEKEIKNGQIWKFQQNMLLNRQLLVKFCERNIFLTTSIGTKLLLFSFLNLMSSKVSLGYFGSRVSNGGKLFVSSRIRSSTWKINSLPKDTENRSNYFESHQNVFFSHYSFQLKYFFRNSFQQLQLKHSYPS